jgi:hypothetical protein
LEVRDGKATDCEGGTHRDPASAALVGPAPKG